VFQVILVRKVQTVLQVRKVHRGLRVRQVPRGLQVVAFQPALLPLKQL
jgi:hypothetical protein